jgi:hypothetical protein
MMTISRALAGTVAACAMAISVATPAFADRGHGFGGGWRGGDNPHMAINRCSRAAEQQAGRYVRGFANVTDIRDVRETRHGYEVRGRIAVKYHGGWRGHDRWHNRGRGLDTGSFKCRVEAGRIVDLDVRGIGRS